MNITGLVKYIGKLGGGRNNGSMFVGLKLDQPGIDSHQNFVRRPRCLKQVTRFIARGAGCFQIHRVLTGSLNCLCLL